MSSCKIHLENYTGTYHAGAQIKGRLECSFAANTTVGGIKVQVRCFERMWTRLVSGTGANGRVRQRPAKLVGGLKVVLFLEKVLLGLPSESTSVSRGRHVYPFSCNLPLDIPASFSGKYGSVSYNIMGVVERATESAHQDAILLKVASPIDLNRMFGHLQNGASYSDEQVVSDCFCKSGSVSVDVDLPRRAFVAGEAVPFKVHVVNMSTANVERLTVKLVKTIFYQIPESVSKVSVYDVVKFQKHGVGAHCEHTYDLELSFPDNMEVPNFQKCTLFTVRYHLQVFGKMRAHLMGVNIVIREIEMGHVPFGNVSSGVPPPYAPPTPPPASESSVASATIRGNPGTRPEAPQIQPNVSVNFQNSHNN